MTLFDLAPYLFIGAPVAAVTLGIGVAIGRALRPRDANQADQRELDAMLQTGAQIVHDAEAIIEAHEREAWSRSVSFGSERVAVSALTVPALTVVASDNVVHAEARFAARRLHGPTGGCAA